MVRIRSAWLAITAGTDAALSLSGPFSTLLPSTYADSTIPAVGFTANDSSVSFALNIPQGDRNNDLYFTLAGPASSSWIAVGMGSHQMANSLIFMAYSDSSGKNVTLSPRLVYNHVEPSYTNLSVTVLAGSGIENDTMTVNAMCTNCRSWNGGSIDPTNTAAEFIFALGPDGDTRSNSMSADIKRHSEYGKFIMNLTNAVGNGGVPVDWTADATVTKQSISVDHNYGPAFHAIIMVIVFLGLMPLGTVILRIFNSPKWHGINQTLSAIGALIGLGLGIYIGRMYNRSKNFNSAHQVFGIIIIIAMIAQWVLGFLHHRIYTRNQNPTKLAPIHVWLGRFVIVCGIINGFLGFPLALNPRFDWALLTLTLLIIIAIGPLAFWRYKRNSSKKAAAAAGSGSDIEGYQAQPWNKQGDGSRSDINLRTMGTGYPPTRSTPIYGQPPLEGRQFV